MFICCYGFWNAESAELKYERKAGDRQASQRAGGWSELRTDRTSARSSSRKSGKLIVWMKRDEEN